MRVLILGGAGMLGHKVFQILSDSHDTVATFRSEADPWSSFPMYSDLEPHRTITGVDALKIESVSAAIAKIKPEVVINCIGIVKQRQEAHDPVLSIKINALFPHLLADLCDRSGSRLIHISTDCVFSGEKGNYTETDQSDAEDLYGRTKYLGEVDRAGALTIRTSIIGREFMNKSGLLEWFLSNRGGTVNGYINAIFSGLTTQALAAVMNDLILDHPELSGVYQIASPAISKYDLLTIINQALDLGIEIIPEEDFRCDRSLDPAKFIRDTKYRIPNWETMISDLAADQTPYEEWRKNTHAGI